MAMTKLSISVTEELANAINLLTKQKHIAKSRLIEQLIRESLEISRSIQLLRMKNVTSCDKCNIAFKKSSLKYNTKFGVLCADCFYKRLGRVIEEHPPIDSSYVDIILT